MIGPTVYANLVQHLLAHQGCIRSYDEILTAMYPDGDEPDSAMECLRFFVMKARESGWKIDGLNRRGYVMP